MQNRLKEIRQEKRLTLEQVGKGVGLSTNAISRYERGVREPKLETWQKIADFLNVPVDYLIGISKDGLTLTIDDLNPEEQDAYERITDMLSQEYPQTRPEFNWSKIGQLLINSDLTEEQFFVRIINVFLSKCVAFYLNSGIIYIEID